MTNLEIIMVIVIVGLSIIMPIYYSYKQKKLLRELKVGREVSEREKIRVYIDQINQQSRDRNRKL